MRLEDIQQPLQLQGSEMQGKGRRYFAEAVASKCIKPVVDIPIVLFEKYDLQILAEWESKLASRGMIYHFNRFWPTLPALHKWISDRWKDLIKDPFGHDCQIYPYYCGIIIFSKPLETLLVSFFSLDVVTETEKHWNFDHILVNVSIFKDLPI